MLVMQLIQLSFGKAARLTLLSLTQPSYGLAISITLGRLLSVGSGSGAAFLPLCLVLMYGIRGESKGRLMSTLHFSRSESVAVPSF